MREEYRIILGNEMRYLAIKTRSRLNITQREMAELLCMSESSYSDIETGRSYCGALTEVLLLKLQDKPSELIDDVSKKFKRHYDNL